jgi:adenosine deaminase
MDAGVAVCVNSDDPGMFNTNIVDEYVALAKYHNFSEEDFRRCNHTAFEASFIPQEKKNKYRHLFQRE